MTAHENHAISFHNHQILSAPKETPRIILSVGQQIKLVEDLENPRSSLVRCAEIASLLLEYVSSNETRNDDLFILTTSSCLNKFNNILEECDLAWPRKFHSTVVALISGLTYSRDCVTYINMNNSNLLGNVYNLIKLCIPVFETSRSKLAWTTEERLSFTLLWNHCVLISSKFAIDPEKPFDIVPDLAIFIFKKIKYVFDKLISGELEANEWDFDNYGLCIIIYMLNVLNFTQYAQLFAKFGLDPIFRFLSIKRVPADFTERTKALDIGICQIINLLSHYVPEELLAADFTQAFTNYIWLNSDYIMHYHRVYSEEKLLLIILNTLIDFSRLSTQAALEFHCLGLPSLLTKFMNVPIDRYNYEIEDLNFDLQMEPFRPPPRPNHAKKHILRDLRGVVLFTIITIECEVRQRVYGVDLSDDELLDASRGLEEFLPDDIKARLAQLLPRIRYKNDDGNDQDDNSDKEYNDDDDGEFDNDDYGDLDGDFDQEDVAEGEEEEEEEEEEVEGEEEEEEELMEDGHDLESENDHVVNVLSTGVMHMDIDHTEEQNESGDEHTPGQEECSTTIELSSSVISDLEISIAKQSDEEHNTSQEEQILMDIGSDDKPDHEEDELSSVNIFESSSEIETKPSPRADLSDEISGTTLCLSEPPSDVSLQNEPPSDVSLQNDPPSSTSLQSEKSPQILYSSSPVEQLGNELQLPSPRQLSDLTDVQTDNQNEENLLSEPLDFNITTAETSGSEFTSK
ncbi:uncharacterized protein LOC106661786 isoform X2 [Cimex lectularius]|uniref:Uncharacterized protein n=1 Tax=Cimex lectularius TaxID=79782 RepID=A0A8I6R9A7_CIMLE|nr:uncharacterized protein LOC106661786 isoform X2 [Cimex lectularius]